MWGENVTVTLLVSPVLLQIIRFAAGVSRCMWITLERFSAEAAYWTTIEPNRPKKIEGQVKMSLKRLLEINFTRLYIYLALINQNRQICRASLHQSRLCGNLCRRCLREHPVEEEEK